MGALVEAGQHLALALAGPILPVDKSLILLVGDGYIAGYFVGSIVLPDVADFQQGTGSPHPSHPDATVEVWRRRWGIGAAIVLSAIWVIGNLTTPADFPIAPLDHNLFGAIPLAGIGALLAAAYAPFVAKRVVKASQQELIPVIVEHRMGERFERTFGGVLAALYVGIWLNPW